MFCKNCGSDLGSGSEFCVNCGWKIDVDKGQNGEEKTKNDIKKTSSNNMVSLVNFVAWLMIEFNILLIAFSGYDDFESWVHTYSKDQYIFVYFGCAVLFLYLGINSVGALKSNNKKSIIRGLISNFIFGVSIIVMGVIYSGLENSFGNSVDNLMIQLVTGIYSENIWGITWICLVISFITLSYKLKEADSD